MPNAPVQGDKKYLDVWHDVSEFTDMKAANEIVPRRRRPQNPIPSGEKEESISWSAYDFMKAEMFTKFGLDGYVPVVSAEMRSRPVPFVSARTPKMARLENLMERRLPGLFKRLAGRLKPPFQTYNKESKVGWPHFCRSEFKKELALRAYCAQREHPHYLDDSFITSNVRLQPEVAAKKRIMQFVDDEGHVYEREVTPDMRAIYVQELNGDYLAMRTRNVYNKAANNLALQMVDSAINNAWASYPVSSHNMFGEDVTKGIRRYVRAIDISHMERFTAVAIPVRRKLIGGHYQAQHEKMDEGGYLVPSDSWRTYWRLRKPHSDYIVQFGSGDSAVAPSQKEVLYCVLWEMHVVVFGMNEVEALDTVLMGNTPFIHIMNYGDDNFWSAHEPGILDKAMKFADEYLDVSEEDPAKFLGFEWLQSYRRFVLPLSSYLLKTYLHERAAVGSLRKYPCHGWVQKRQIYRVFGDSAQFTGVFELENQLLEAAGTSWAQIENRASQEQEEMAKEAKATEMAWFGKDYLMSPEELMATGRYDGLSPEESAPWVKDMLEGGSLEEVLTS